MRKRILAIALALLPFLCLSATIADAKKRALPNTAQAVFSTNSAWIDRTMKRMSLSEKVGQMIVANLEGQYRGDDNQDYQLLTRLATEGKIGGIMFLKGDILGASMLVNHFQLVSNLPLLISADMERGLAMRLEGATEFPPSMAVAATGDPELARAMAKTIAREARAVGISQDYAPTVDLNINPANPVINTRSFGDRIQVADTMSTAIIEGLQSSNVAATAKHFPGHGDVTVDSHLALPILAGDRQRLENYELKPFRAAVSQGVMSVMVGHLAVPKLTGNLEPASLSKSIVTDLLRRDIGFSGLIITDALNMKALRDIGTPSEIAVRAVQAGNDLLLFPPDPELAHDAVVDAVRNGTIPERRIDESVRRILQLKQWLGLDRNRMVDLSRLHEAVGLPESRQLAERIAEQSVTLVRDRNHLLPLHPSPSGPVLNIVLQDKPGEEHVRTFRKKLSEHWRVLHVRLDPSTREKSYRETLRLAEQASAVILTTDIQAVPANGLAKQGERQLAFVRSLPGRVPATTPLIFVSFGTPYLLDHVPEIGTALCAYSAGDPAESSVMRVLLGELVPPGKLPVSLQENRP